MSAPPGYNESASMIPDIGGTIRAMHGGFSASPYTGGVTAENSLLPKVSEVVAPITNYSGGAVHDVAVATTFLRNSLEPLATTAALPPASAALPPASIINSPEPTSSASSASQPVATTSLQPSTSQVSQVSTGPLSSSDATLIVNDLTSNPSAQAAIGTIATIAASANNGNNGNNARSNIANTGNDVGKESNLIEEVENEKKDEEEETKTIKVYGKEYKVTEPHKQNKGWNSLMAILGLDTLPEEDQQEFKDMIYKDSTCIEKDLPISTSIKCEATRKFIFKVAEKLLDTPQLNSNGTKIEIKFDPEKQVESLSVTNIGILSETGSEKGKLEKSSQEPVIKPQEPVIKPQELVIKPAIKPQEPQPSIKQKKPPVGTLVGTLVEPRRSNRLKRTGGRTIRKNK